jgi:3-oxoadipate enol-lactonase
MASRTVVNGKFELNVEVDDFSAPWKKEKSHILLQHGFGRSSTIWTTWVPHLCAHYPLVRPDLRGLRTRPENFDPATDLSLDGYLGDICRILDDLGVDAVHYCGESFGGSIGIALAARHPDRVKSLSLVATPAFQNAKWHENYAMGYPSWSAAMEALGLDRWLAETNRTTRFPPTVGEDFVAWYNGQIKGAHQDVLIGMARLIETADLRPLLKNIRAPVLLLSPIGGGIMTPEQIDAYRNDVENFTLVSFETGFHKIQLLHATECARQVGYFCSRVDGRGLIDV